MKDEDIKKKFINYNKHILYYYSPYNILRKIDKETVLEQTIYPDLNDPNIICIEIKAGNKKHFFYVKHLEWDSKFNEFPTYKLMYCLYNHRDYKTLNNAVNRFIKKFFSEKRYCFAEVPSEDILLIQSLNFNCFKLIETRLTHYIEDISSYSFERYPVRLATKRDIPYLKEAASKTINPYDRLHADRTIKEGLADKYLATYVENSVNGFADAVIVPDMPNTDPKAFMVLSFLKEDSDKLNHKIGRLQLSTVDTSFKGWYLKLASESIYYAKKNGIKSMLVTTQATNRAAFHSSEKKGFKLGSVTHVFSFSNLE